MHEILQAVILEHARRAPHRGKLPPPARQAHASNPLCGDEVELSILLHADEPMELTFDGAGCAISQASASLLTVTMRGKSAAEAQQLHQAFLQQMASGVPEAVLSPELQLLAELKNYPQRIPCALCAWEALGKLLCG
jgi:nitrogen fixation NifU-like protein